MRRATALLAIALAFVPPLAAQQVRGVVLDSAAGGALPGAVVMALDSSGVTRGRTISGGDGRFALTPTMPAVRLRVIRIGYSPAEMRLSAAAPSTSLRIVMHRLPAALSAMRVTGRELCPGSAERGAAFELWEQARAGLLAAVVTREANPADATMLMFNRTLSPDDELVREMHVESQSGRTTRPFISPEPAAAFAVHGYMREAEDRSREFAAPDADVLLDQSFATVHCFHLQPADAAHPGQIGLAFTPVATHDTLVDVSGVIWMDGTRAALRSLDFRYTSLEPAARAANAGGVIDFRSMPNGVSFIDRWIMHLPALTEEQSRQRTVRDPAQFHARRATDYRAHVSAIVETGGQVLTAKWDDGVSWRANPTGIAGRVTSDGRPASGAVVALEGANVRATANAKGEFTFDRLVPGTYALVATDTSLINYVDERRAERTIRVRADTLTPIVIDLPRFAAMLDRVCHKSEMPKESAILLGQIVNDRGEPDPTVHLTATWQANYNNGGPLELDRDVRVNGASQQTDADDQGRFSICGVVTQRPIHLRASRGRAYSDTTIQVLPDSVFKTIRWYPRIPAGPPDR